MATREICPPEGENYSAVLRRISFTTYRKAGQGDGWIRYDRFKPFNGLVVLLVVLLGLVSNLLLVTRWIVAGLAPGIYANIPSRSFLMVIAAGWLLASIPFFSAYYFGWVFRRRQVLTIQPYPTWELVSWRVDEFTDIWLPNTFSRVVFGLVIGVIVMSLGVGFVVGVVDVLVSSYA